MLQCVMGGSIKYTWRSKLSLESRDGRTRTELDFHVGRRIVQRRELTQKTQAEIAKALGISAQQVQKYESGQSRISASRLKRLADVLDTPVAWFFDATDDLKNVASRDVEPRHRSGVVDGYTLELLRIFQHIDSVDLRRKIVEYAEAVYSGKDNTFRGRSCDLGVAQRTRIRKGQFRNEADHT